MPVKIDENVREEFLALKKRGEDWGRQGKAGEGRGRLACIPPARRP